MRFLTSLATLAIAVMAMPWGSTPASAQEVVTEAITCESIDRQRVECPVKGRLRSVRQTAALAGGFCLQGFSWGYESGYIWVDMGCSGIFEVEALRDVATEQRRPDRETFSETLDCRSQGSGRQKCRVEGRIENVEPVGSFTSVPCRYGTSWGYEKRHVWVERGCEARFNVTFTRRVADAEPAPAPEVKPERPKKKKPARQNGSTTGLASSPLSDIVAQGACMGLYPSLGSGGFVFAVPRECSRDAPDCKAVCAGVTKTIDNASWRKSLRNRQLACFNSVHVYDNGPAQEKGVAGLRSYVYNECGGQCGPNYCCCSAE